MRTTTYKCDRCESESTDPRHTESVGVHVGTYPQARSYGAGDSFVSLTKDWCLKCRQETGLIRPQSTQKTEEVPPPITLEEMVREIVREEIGGLPRE